MHVLVLQHIACESPGVYEDVLRERSATIYRVELDEHEPLPDWHGFEAIIDGRADERQRQGKTALASR